MAVDKGDVPPHLEQPCYAALWRAMIRDLYPDLRALSIRFLFPNDFCSRVAVVGFVEEEFVLLLTVL